MTYSIVPISEEYIAGFHAALDVVAKEKKYLTFTEAPPLNSTQAFVRSNIAEGQIQMVVVDQGQVVGWCDILSSSRESLQHIGTLGTGLLPAYRGRGIGSALLKECIRRAQDKGLTRIDLIVNADNLNAIALYKKLGFETEGIKRKGTFLDDEYKDVIMMAIVK